MLITDNGQMTYRQTLSFKVQNIQMEGSVKESAPGSQGHWSAVAVLLLAFERRQWGDKQFIIKWEEEDSPTEAVTDNIVRMTNAWTHALGMQGTLRGSDGNKTGSIFPC